MPINRLQLPPTRTTGTVTITSLGDAIYAVYVGPAALGGLVFQPFRPPLDWDRSRHATLWINLFNPAGGTLPTAPVALRVRRTIATNGASRANLNTVLYYDIPDFLPIQQSLFVNPEDPADTLFPAHAFGPNDLIGLEVTRNGADPADTWTGNLGICGNAWIDYPQNCRYPCL